MKKYLLVLGLSILAFAACNVEKPEIVIEQDNAEPAHLTVDFNITRGDIPGTKDVKQDWETGDVIMFLFDKVMDGEYMSLRYDGSVWDAYWSSINTSLEQAVAQRGSGTVSGISVFLRQSAYHGWHSDDYQLFDVFADDVKSMKHPAYTWFLTCVDASYTVTDGKLKADIKMTMPAEHNFVQFFIPNLLGDLGQYTLKTDPAIYAVTPYMYHKVNGFCASYKRDGLLPGYPYAGGMVFCGDLQKELAGVPQDYTFTLTDNVNSEAYEYSVSSKTLSRGKAVKLPVISNWQLVIDGGHDYVDLGLPSGIKWATTNLGSSAPEEFGGGYPWGHTTSAYLNGDWSAYRFYTSGSTVDDVVLSKYFADDTSMTIVTLDLEDDAANVNWGGNWRIPTRNDWEELANNCSVTTTTRNGRTGTLITSLVPGYTDKSIFLPEGPYWSSTLYNFQANSSKAFYSVVYNNQLMTSVLGARIDDYEIRPVYDETIGPEVVNAVALCDAKGQTLYVADRNLGAADPYSPGKYFAWGDTTGYLAGDFHYFGYQSYVFTATNVYMFSKYVRSTDTQHWGGTGNPDNLTRLEAADDAANVALGNGWHIPDFTELVALHENCDWEWDAVHNGYLVKGRGTYAGNSVFLPVSGTWDGDYVYEANQAGYIQSCELSDVDQNPSAYYSAMGFSSDNIYYVGMQRYFGMPIRAVKQ